MIIPESYCVVAFILLTIGLIFNSISAISGQRLRIKTTILVVGVMFWMAALMGMVGGGYTF
jgi:hypothetical protein